MPLHGIQRDLAKDVLCLDWHLSFIPFAKRKHLVLSEFIGSQACYNLAILFGVGSLTTFQGSVAAQLTLYVHLCPFLSYPLFMKSRHTHWSNCGRCSTYYAVYTCMHSMEDQLLNSAVFIRKYWAINTTVENWPSLGRVDNYMAAWS